MVHTHVSVNVDDDAEETLEVVLVFVAVARNTLPSYLERHCM